MKISSLFASSSSSSIILGKQVRLSPYYILPLFAFIAFATVLYSQEFDNIFSKVENSYTTNINKTTDIIKNAKLPFSIGENNEEECDLFSGKWVWDRENRPLYEESECPYIQSQLTCQAGGRLDKDYQHWKWQPHGCSLPRYF